MSEDDYTWGRHHSRARSHAWEPLKHSRGVHTVCDKVQFPGTIEDLQERVESKGTKCYLCRSEIDRRERVASGELESTARRALAEAWPDALTATEIRRKHVRSYTRKEVSNVLADLEDAGLVQLVPVEGHTRRPVVATRKLLEAEGFEYAM